MKKYFQVLRYLNRQINLRHEKWLRYLSAAEMKMPKLDGLPKCGGRISYLTEEALDLKAEMDWLVEIEEVVREELEDILRGFLHDEDMVDILIMYYGQDQSVQEISAWLDIPVKRVYYLRNKAFKLLSGET